MIGHEIYMQRCLELAALGAGNVAPNPMVGALLVHNDTIIAEGFHEQFGRAHAEVNCINNVPAELYQLVKESRLYVSLEPCNHFGKTPPCTDLIIKHKIPTVVIACTDPFEKVNGSGIKKLKEAGVNVITGIMDTAALELNRRFFTFHKKQRPYIILKWAQSNDLKIASSDHTRVMISNELTNRLVHKWRAEEAAIMVGSRTALQDDPSLTTRLWPGNDPVRIVIDKNLELPAHLHLFDKTVPTIILNNLRQEEDGNNNYYKTGNNENIIAVTISILRLRNLVSLIVEGGATLLQSFIDLGCWDEARVITNKNMNIGNGIAAPVLKNEVLIKKEQLLDDEISIYRNAAGSL
ncbi:MAG: bifunctional diaminohydroxyphosphoribosylaminopyrimidine deaminase/5-amino-6-(5-phosphoribosylamino)uracil reductase RibD [Ferruginibacter sp.]